MLIEYKYDGVSNLNIVANNIKLIIEVIIGNPNMNFHHIDVRNSGVHGVGLPKPNINANSIPICNKIMAIAPVPPDI